MITKRIFFKDFWSGKKICFLSIVVLFFLGLFCAKGLFKYYAISTHDGDYHIARVFDAIQTTREGYFPLRWAGSLNYFCGVPVFNFFYPLIYYLALVLNLIFKDVVVCLKLLASLSFILGPIFFYLWLYKETKNYAASFLGGFLYLFLPYRFLLVYVRFSPEFLTYTLLPVLLFFLSKLFIKLEKKNQIGFNFWFLSFFVVILMVMFLISHNFAIVLLFPVVLLFILAKFWTDKDFSIKKAKLFLLLVLSSLTLSSFFLGPMFFEKKFVRLGSQNVVNCLDHFPTVGQIVRSKWGYGGSMPGEKGDLMSFSLGYAQWLVIIFSILYLLKTFIREKKELDYWIIFWLLLSLGSIFFTLSLSSFFWRRSKILCDLQFPWRFLGVSGLAVAALSAHLLKGIKNRTLFFSIFLILILIGFLGNRNHLLAQPVLNINKYIDFGKNHPARFAPTMVNDDILNKESKSACNFQDEFLTALSHRPLDYTVSRKNNSGEIIIKQINNENVTLRLNLEFFPGIYKIGLNNKNFSGLENCQGKLCLRNIYLAKGINRISWKIVQSPIENFFNFVSLGTLGIWCLILINVWLKEKKER
ncbi:MAG: hypothetical protein BWY24_00788 [Microgenomates group bacterium ADurb.Bin219]|nr:MAG: hypothetical protein BWY24_00788 [Microgenomates group bacterium ADurb.Bin219]